MKHSLLLNLILLCTLTLPAFSQDTTWFNGNWKDTTRAQAKYFRIKTKSGQGWQVKDYWISGDLQMTGAFIDDSCTVQQGEFAYYDEKKHLTRRVNYTAGKEEGKEIYYYDNGHIRAEGNNKAGKHDGEWKGYFKSGKPSGQALYETGRQVSAKFFNEDGTPNKGIKEFIKESEFPKGGPKALLRYLIKNMKYPEQAYKNKITGTPVVEFVISKDGTIIKAHVINQVDRLLAEEALRVIREMPDWEPAILGGTPIDSYKQQPIVFRIE